jgi:hypothetical protein
MHGQIEHAAHPRKLLQKVMHGAQGQVELVTLAPHHLDAWDVHGSRSVLAPDADALAITEALVDRSHNDLLLTLARAMGVDMTTFGDPSLCTGPITQLLV